MIIVCFCGSVCFLQTRLWEEEKRDAHESLCNAHWGGERVWTQVQPRCVCVCIIILTAMTCACACSCLCVIYVSASVGVCLWLVWVQSMWPSFVYVSVCLTVYVLLCALVYVLLQEMGWCPVCVPMCFPVHMFVILLYWQFLCSQVNERRQERINVPCWTVLSTIQSLLLIPGECKLNSTSFPSSRQNKWWLTFINSTQNSPIRAAASVNPGWMNSWHIYCFLYFFLTLYMTQMTDEL